VMLLVVVLLRLAPECDTIRREMFSVRSKAKTVYTIQPVVKPVEQPVECLFIRCTRLFNRLFNRFDNRLYRVNGL